MSIWSIVFPDRRSGLARMSTPPRAAKVESLELEVLGVELFSNKEPLKEDNWLSSRRYSPSKLAIVLSDFTFLTFVALIGISFLRAKLTLGSGTLDIPVTLALGGTGLFILLARRAGRSGN